MMWINLYLLGCALLCGISCGIEIEREGWPKAFFYATAAIVFIVGARS